MTAHSKINDMTESLTPISVDHKIYLKNGKWYADFEHRTTKSPEKNYGTGTTHYMTVHDNPVDAFEALKNYLAENGFCVKDEEAWARYYRDLKSHHEVYNSRKPRRENYHYEEEFKKDYSRWDMDSSLFEPNKPGYFRANND
jgi:hypothetical protein